MYSWPLNNTGVKVTDSPQVENLPVTFDSIVIPVHLWIQPTIDGKQYFPLPYEIYGYESTVVNL